jgi:hypothetical protein
MKGGIKMREKESKTGKNASARKSQNMKDNDQEMNECLAKLKVWRVENLMSPTGMDRFSQDISKNGPEKAADKRESPENKKGNLPLSRSFDKRVMPVGRM